MKSIEPRVNLKHNDKFVNFSYKNSKGAQPKPISVLQTIKLTSHFFEGLGLYIGESEKTEKGKALSFTNSDKDLLNIIINWLEKYFGIPKKELMFTVISPNSKDLDILNKKWANSLKVNINQFTKPSIPIRNPGNLDRVRIFRNKILYRRLLDSVTKESLQYTLKNKSWGNGFLRGFYAAEGSVILRKNKINQIYLCGKDLEILTLIKNLLINRLFSFSREPIRTCKKGRNKDNQYEILIFSVDNFKKAKKIQLFRLNRERHLKFNKGLSNLLCAGAGVVKRAGLRAVK